jgi:hypothetical protein
MENNFHSVKFNMSNNNSGIVYNGELNLYMEQKQFN